MELRKVEYGFGSLSRFVAGWVVLVLSWICSCAQAGDNRVLPVGCQDSILAYRDSIVWCENNYRKSEWVEKSLAYSRREDDFLAYCTFKLEWSYLSLSQGRYLETFDTLLSLEKDVADFMGRPSLLQDDKIAVFYPKSRGDSLWRDLHVAVGLGLAESEIYLNEFTEAANIVIAVRKSYAYDSTDLVSVRCYNAMGAIFAHQGLLEQAKEFYFMSLRNAGEELPKIQLATIYANLSSAYAVLDQPEASLKYALECYGTLRSIGFYGEKYIYSLFYMGAAYFKLGQYKLAEDYLYLALKEAETKQFDHLAVYIRSNLVAYFFSIGQFDRAESFSKANLVAARKIKNRVLEESSALILAQIYDKEGNYFKSLQYLDTAYVISKVLSREDQELRMGYQRRMFENYKQEQQRLQSEQALALANSKLQNRNLWIVITVFLGCILAVLLFFLYRRLRIQRKLNRLIKMRLDESESQSQDQLEHLQDDMRQALNDKDKELTAMALYYVKVQGLMDSLGEKLKAMRVMGLKARERMYVSEMDNLLRSFAPDKNWNEFELYFRRVDKGFFENLEVRYPGLTPNEKRLCALIRLNLTTKEIATMTSRTVNSVNTAKTRLKQKFGCEKDVSLYDFLADL